MLPNIQNVYKEVFLYTYLPFQARFSLIQQHILTNHRNASVGHIVSRRVPISDISSVGQQIRMKVLIWASSTFKRSTLTKLFILLPLLEIGSCPVQPTRVSYVNVTFQLQRVLPTAPISRLSKIRVIQKNLCGLADHHTVCSTRIQHFREVSILNVSLFSHRQHTVPRLFNQNTSNTTPMTVSGPIRVTMSRDVVSSIFPRISH